jgi:DNA repair protein RadC
MRELNISEIKEMNLTFQKGIRTSINKIRSSQESAEIFRKIIGDDINVRECVVILAVSRDLKVTGYYFLSKGGIAASVVDHLLFLKLAVVSNSASFIIAHNHPSGNIKPSGTDLKLTDQLIEKSKGVVDILDHLIVTENSYYSMREEGTVSGLASINFDYLEIPTSMPQLIEDTNSKNNHTMITISNITKEYPKINQTTLPEPLKKEEFDFIKENLDLYNEDDTIKEYIDTFVLKLNEIAGKSKPKAKKETSRKRPVKKTQAKARTTPKKRSIKRSSNSSQKPKANTRSVGNVDLQVSLIKSFVLMHNKSKTKKQVLNLYKRIEKAATELKIRKKSKYADEIKYAAKTLQSAYNNTKGGSDTSVAIKIPEKQFEKLYKIGYSEKQKLSVQYIKRYIGMYGAKDMFERADRLLTNINIAIKKKKITSKDMYYDRINTIQKVLNNFISKENAVLYPEAVNLKGLTGIAGVDLPKKKSLVVNKSLSGINDNVIPSRKANSNALPDGIVSSEQLKNMKFDNLEFSGDWKELIGNPSKPFHIMIYGLPGSGKSTQSVNFVKYMANNHEFKVLYLAKEEGVSNTIQEKFKRLNAFHPNIFITADMPDDLSFFDLLVIDSVNEMNMTPDDIRKIQETYPNLSTWQIFKATKEGKFLGQSDFGHLCQTELVCSEGSCQAHKNRFGGNTKTVIEF